MVTTSRRRYWTEISFALAVLCCIGVGVATFTLDRSAPNGSRNAALASHMEDLESALGSASYDAVQKGIDSFQGLDPTQPTYYNVRNYLLQLRAKITEIQNAEQALHRVSNETEKVQILERIVQLRGEAQTLVFAGEGLLGENRNEESDLTWFRPYLFTIAVALMALAAILAIQLVHQRRMNKDRLAVEEALRESEIRLRAFFDHVSEGIYQISTEGKILSVNPALVKMLGYDSEDELLALENISDHHFHPESRNAGAHPFEWEGNREVTLRRKDGVPVAALENCRAVRDTLGNIRYFEGVLLDISEHKLVQQQVAEARDQASRVLQLKTRFLASVSHEIRTPVNGIIGMTNMLLDTDLAPAQHDIASSVRKSAAYLLDILNDMLDFSRIEAGKLELEQTEFLLRPCVAEVIKQVIESAESRGIEVVSNVQDDVPDRLTGDPGRLRQVLLNLAGNAVKFTERGEVVLNVGIKRISGSKVTLLFEVTDTGIGITPAQMSHIFEPFQQGDSANARKYGGTGLGLSISRRLVEMMGGKISVFSIPDRGSTFSFDAEFQFHSSSQVPIRTESLKGRRISILEDNAAAARVIEEQARVWEMIPATYSSTGVYRDIAAPGDFVLVDWQMPGVTADFVRAIAQDTPVVVMTNYGQRNLPVRAGDANILSVMTKPVRFDMLKQVLTGDVRVPSTPVRAAVRPVERTKPATRILVAEDNVINQRVARKMLERLGCEVDVVENGLEAINALTFGSYALVLMDCQMPEMDGFEATAAIRRLESGGQNIPIVAMTAHAMKGDRDRCLQAGMNDYISKPIRSEVLASVLGRWIELGAIPERTG